MDIKNLTGISKSHTVPLNSKEGAPLVHSLMIDSYLKLYNRCKEEGIELKIISSFRSFDKQLQIWNAKANGQRPVLDKDNNEINLSYLSDLEKIHYIMRWSALPGASRHHWGTDIDVIDESVLDENYQVQLIPQEYNEDGIFSNLSNTLTKLIENNRSFNFYRPYETDRNGVAQELWHISFSPLADDYKKLFTFEVFENFLKEQDKNNFALLESIIENSKEIYDRYIFNTD